MSSVVAGLVSLLYHILSGTAHAPDINAVADIWSICVPNDTAIKLNKKQNKQVLKALGVWNIFFVASLKIKANITATKIAAADMALSVLSTKTGAFTKSTTTGGTA
jgi:hypothetical protein